MNAFVLYLCLLFVSLNYVASARQRECRVLEDLQYLGCSCVEYVTKTLAVTCVGVQRHALEELGRIIGSAPLASGVQIEWLTLADADEVLPGFPAQFFRNVPVRRLKLTNVILESIVSTENDMFEPFVNSSIARVILDNVTVLNNDWRPLSAIEDQVNYLDIWNSTFSLNAFLNQSNFFSLKSLKVHNATDIPQDVENGILLKLTELTELRLWGVNLTVLNTSNFPSSITSLDLGANKLETVDKDIRLNLPNLVTINLSDNDIPVIDFSIFNGFNGTLVLTGNPINCEDRPIFVIQDDCNQ